MSLESKIEALTAAVVELTLAMRVQTNPLPAPAAQHIPPIVASQPQAPIQAPPSLDQVATSTALANATAAAAAAFVPPAPPAMHSMPMAPPAAPAMPPPPSFVTPPAPAAAAGGAPFTDSKGLISWVTQAYTAMGAAKGAKIQDIIVQLGYKAINEVQPQHYAAFHQAVEALRVSP